MRAVVLGELDKSPVLKDIKEPRPEDEQQVLDVKAAPVKTLDRLMTMKSFYGSFSNLPVIIGTDGAGVLESGERVYAQGITGMYAEKSLVQKENYTILPDNLDFETAAALPNAIQGSALPMRLRGHIQKGSRILINGATGFTGQVAVQAAQHYGAENIVATGRDAKRLEKLKDLGADQTISLLQSDEEVTNQLKTVLDEGAIDIVIDYLWGQPAGNILKVLAAGPTHAVRFINVGNLAGNDINIAAGILRSSAIEVLGAGLGSYKEEELQQFSAELIPEMFQLAAKGVLTVTTQRESLEDIEQIWKQEGEAGTRLVICPD